MFRDNRQFRAVLMCCPKLTGLDAVRGALPSDRFTLIEDLGGASDNGTQVAHLIYRTESAFLDEDALANVKIEADGKVYYEYNMYVCIFRRKRISYLLWSVPLARMAAEVFGLIDAMAFAVGRKYLVPNLIALTEFLQSNDDDARRFAVTGVHFDVGGDSDTRSVLVRGANVLVSTFLFRTQSGLKGIQLVPKRIRMSEEGEASRFSCECDGFGNFWFRVKNQGHSLYHASAFLDPLFENNIIRSDRTFPLRRTMKEKEEADERE